jgi:anthranilate synthase/aminodeoxychorismate synthase-like glutamine amidotransferase
MKTLVIDNYDSFTYNLVDYLSVLGADVDVVRNDKATVADLLKLGYKRCLLSPGPCTPNQAGITLEAAYEFPMQGIPTLGVCLGHQAIAQVFGGKVELHHPVHGKAAVIKHDGKTIFQGLPKKFKVGRYHSLIVVDLPPVLEESASDGKVNMAFRHTKLPVEGVQFHPESVLTDEKDGKLLLKNFLEQNFF